MAEERLTIKVLGWVMELRNNLKNIQFQIFNIHVLKKYLWK